MPRSEHKEQVDFIHKAKKHLRANDKGELVPLLFAIPNGGNRDARTAGSLKMEGVRKGVPDLFFACPKGTFHGLFIEMKQLGAGRTSKEQDEMLRLLGRQGYCCVVCHGFEAALDAFVDYLDIKRGGEI